MMNLRFSQLENSRKFFHVKMSCFTVHFYHHKVFADNGGSLAWWDILGLSGGRRYNGLGVLTVWAPLIPVQQQSGLTSVPPPTCRCSSGVVSC